MKYLSSLVLILLISSCSINPQFPLANMSLSDKPLLGKFVWHDLISSKAEEDKRFYSAIFAWQYEKIAIASEEPYFLIKSNNHAIGGILDAQEPTDQENISRWVGYLSVDDVDKAVRQNSQSGGQTVLSPVDIDTIGRVAGIIDPQGAVLGLSRIRFGDLDDSVSSPVPGQIIWNELLATDVLNAVQYYSQLANYRIKQIKKDGAIYTTLNTDDKERAGILKNPIEYPDAIWLSYFYVTDLDDAIKKVIQHGGKILMPPSPEVRNGSMALITDPSGALLALWQGELSIGL